MQNSENQPRSTHPRDHMANERTFLAWIRTSVVIMAFGFVVEKFTLVIKQMGPWLEKQHLPLPSVSSKFQGFSSIFGVLLVAFGVLICLLAFLRYKKIEKQIENEKYEPSIVLNIMLTLAVLSIGVFLVIYLNDSI